MYRDTSVSLLQPHSFKQVMYQPKLLAMKITEDLFIQISDSENIKPILCRTQKVTNFKTHMVCKHYQETTPYSCTCIQWSYISLIPIYYDPDTKSTWQTLTNGWSRSWLAVHLIFGSLSRQWERKSFPSGLTLSGIGGLWPIPTLYMIWKLCSYSCQGLCNK